jgi:hypothetical protein
MHGARKYVEVLVFILVWMAAGWIFHLDANAYLLLGVPLVVLFQLFIARRPLRNLWVRDATTFRLGLIGIVLAALLILAPGYDKLSALPKKSLVVRHIKQSGIRWNALSIKYDLTCFFTQAGDGGIGRWNQKITAPRPRQV